MLAAVVALLFFGGDGFIPLRADQVAVNPVADSFIKANSFDSPNTGGSNFVTGTTAQGGIMRGLLRFDLPGVIPAGAVVRSATLTVRVTKAPFGAASSTFELRRVLQSWDEVGVTWDLRGPGVPWSVAGATGAVDVAEAVSATVLMNSVGGYTFATAPALVADIQAWVNTPGTNFGWLLRSQSEDVPTTARLIASREATANKPTLTITYDPPATPPTLTVLPLNNAQLRFSFSAEANRPYVVESRAVFGSGAWGVAQPLAAPPSAVVLTVTNPSAGAAKFFRVRTP